MSTQAAHARPIGSGIIPYRVTVREFERMIDAGVFPESAHIELLTGILSEMPDKMTKNHRHDYVIAVLAERLRALIGTGWIVREEKAIQLGTHWRPEPDLAVARGPHSRYGTGHPKAADLALLVEAADASYEKDRGLKLRRYAAAGIAMYWIVNIARRQVEVFSEPSGRGASATYRDNKIFRSGDVIPVVIEGRETGRIPVDDIFPADA